MNQQYKAFLAGQLRTFRRAAGLTQEDLASRVERTAEAISNIERGKSLPTIETLVAVSEALKVPLRDFFPTGSFDDKISKNRLKAEAEAISHLRCLSDNLLEVATTQIKALKNI